MLRKCINPWKSSSRNASLIADPLTPGRISKSQTKSLFPHPKIVSFDLWNTLFTTRAPISQQYYAISHGEFGLAKSLQSIETDFPKLHDRMEQEYPNYGKYSASIESSNDWWKELIVRLYGLQPTEEIAQKLSQRLIQHFTSSDAYVLFDDVVPVLQTLQKNQVRIIGASNSDDRVLSVIESLGIGSYFPESAVHLSYDLGITKPNRHFFQQISRNYFAQDSKYSGSSTKMTDFLENSWHIGDHYENDFVGAVKSGWNGVLLDRAKQSVFLRQAHQKKAISNDCFEGQSTESLDGDDLVMISNNRVCVSGLQEVLKLFGYKA